MKKMTQKQLDIINAALLEFEANGFPGAGMERVADLARVSKRTLYRYFPNKESLFTAMMEYLHGQSLEIPLPVFSPELPAKDQLNALLEAMFRNLNVERNRRLARIILAEMVRDPEHGRLLNQAAWPQEAGPLRWIRDAMAAGAIRSGDPEIAFQQLSAVVKSYFYWPRAHGSASLLTTEELRLAVDDTLALFWAAYGGDSDQARP